jgi:hypothetical protein
MGDYKHGQMNIDEQKKTFEGFINVIIWVTCISIGVLLFLAVFNS